MVRGRGYILFQPSQGQLQGRMGFGGEPPKDFPVESDLGQRRRRFRRISTGQEGQFVVGVGDTVDPCENTTQLVRHDLSGLLILRVSMEPSNNGLTGDALNHIEGRTGAFIAVPVRPGHLNALRVDFSQKEKFFPETEGYGKGKGTVIPHHHGQGRQGIVREPEIKPPHLLGGSAGHFMESLHKGLFEPGLTGHKGLQPIVQAVLGNHPGISSQKAVAGKTH